ncbi:MAG: hypothetical protein Kow00128_16680 [Deltaproteobacteria bacterium]
MISGKRLTAIASALMLLAAGGAVRLLLSGALRPAPAPAVVEGGESASSIDAHLAAARAAETRGDVAGALAHYREAASLDPLCVDRNSSRFLGPGFEEKLRRWSADLRSGRMKAAPAALRDASYLFRRMYGGCG